jgi:CBS domain-containing protein
MALLVWPSAKRERVTSSPEASVTGALTLCRERRIRHIPILEEGRLVGIVSDRDLRDASLALGDAGRSFHKRSAPPSEGPAEGLPNCPRRAKTAAC